MPFLSLSLIVAQTVTRPKHTQATEYYVLGLPSLDHGPLESERRGKPYPCFEAENLSF